MGAVSSLLSKPKTPDYGQMQFQPYSISGPLGGVKFDTDDKSAEVTLDPGLQALLDVYFKGAEDFLPSPAQEQFATDLSTYGKTLFGEATSRDIDAQVADEYQRRLDLLSTERAAEDVRLKESLYGTGRTGAAVSLGTGGYIQPEIYSQQLARERINLGLLTDVDDLVRARQQEDIKQGIGLYGTGQELRMNPYTQSYGLFSQAASIPGLLDPYLDAGISAGRASADAGKNIAQMQNQRYESQLGFWGNLIGGGLSVLGKPEGGSDGLFSSFSNPFASTPPKVGSTDFWRGTPSFSWSSPSTWF